ncbi:hypothetical protein EZV73_25135 [Acidaminobacter sp. JC074]|uniref:PucR family transcriptional regulator n=1 Tax=Acidaminobacter sp. JC074 TaxID=2530199 RepID=UPI001F0E9B8E|nr:helix-turn-helix domain-containing protein [Acidaminobacter sp. JC074]MCH4890889.1 hypothetical protein [Acidaminobacter sp. JC074]
MFKYNNLEQILDTRLNIYKHSQCIYSCGSDNAHEYENDSYRITSSRPLDENQVQLIKLIIDTNEQKQPFWYRVLKDLPYSIDELPKSFESCQYFETWLVKGHHISDSIEMLLVIMEVAEVLVLNQDMLLLIVNENESITPENVIGHLEAEAMISAKVYVGPSVNAIEDLKTAYEKTQQLISLSVKNTDRIIRFKDVLYLKVLHHLSEENKVSLMEDYLKIYPVHQLNEELIETIYGFFNHNLNVTDTANALFLHRNTLVYRLNKILQLTNLDIKQFDDANIMRILLSLI